jgi:hypothetical protein
LEAFEDEGFEGEVLLGGELDELLFEVLGDLDGAHGLGSLVGGGRAELVKTGLEVEHGGWERSRTSSQDSKTFPSPHHDLLSFA